MRIIQKKHLIAFKELFHNVCSSDGMAKSQYELKIVTTFCVFCYMLPLLLFILICDGTSGPYIGSLIIIAWIVCVYLSLILLWNAMIRNMRFRIRCENYEEHIFQTDLYVFLRKEADDHLPMNQSPPTWMWIVIVGCFELVPITMLILIFIEIARRFSSNLI